MSVAPSCNRNVRSSSGKECMEEPRTHTDGDGGNEQQLVGVLFDAPAQKRVIVVVVIVIVLRVVVVSLQVAVGLAVGAILGALELADGAQRRFLNDPSNASGTVRVCARAR